MAAFLPLPASPEEAPMKPLLYLMGSSGEGTCWGRWICLCSLKKHIFLSSLLTGLRDIFTCPFNRDSVEGYLFEMPISLPLSHSGSEAEWINGKRK